jgi:hypothetical protein
MKSFDAEVLKQTLDWMDRNGKGDKPFFVWFNTTAIHVWSHVTKEYLQKAVNEGRAEEDVVRAKMIEHDEQVGAILKKIEDLASPTTRSSSIPPTTATSFCFGPTVAMPHSAAKRARPGKEVFASPA